MSRFDTWAAQNKRNRGGNDVQMDINLGGGDLLGVKGGKEREYLELRAKVTNTILIRMRELLNVCKTELEFFSRLEDENVSLMYLVALGITTEENITSYRTMRNRGIDTYKIREEALGKRIDASYLREIKSMEKDNPPLLNIKGDNIEKTLIRDISELRKLENPLEKDDVDTELVVKKASVDSLVKEISLDDTFASFEAEEEIASKEIAEIQESFSGDAISSWKSILTSIQEDVTTTEKTDEEVVPEDANKRTIYILANEFATPYSEKYNFVFVKHSRSLGNFTASKNNLLVVTQEVPPVVLDSFLNWLRGMVASEDKYRITTLKNSPMKSKYIQGELEDLSEESIDRFYDRHENAEYIGDGVGTFFDLTSLIEDDELLD